MIDLTDELLRPSTGILRYWPADLDHPVAGPWAITLPLAPFSADDEFEPATFRPGTAGPELVTTEIMLDLVALPGDGPAALSRRTFTFPVNPNAGFIDGPISLLAPHCPLNVTRIDLGPAPADQTQPHLPAPCR